MIDVKIQYVVWSDRRRAWLATEGSGLFYTTDPDKVRVFPTQEEANKWVNSAGGEIVQRWIGA